MGARERVRDAIQAPVEAAERERDELRDADVETRLTVLIDGWARGFAAAFEELAVALDDLERRLPAGEPGEVVETEPPSVEITSEGRRDEPDLADADEDRLLDEARRSRAATAELRDEGEDARRELEG